eukprot:5283351-Pyramimonas_sp.AAC.1
MGVQNICAAAAPNPHIPPTPMRAEGNMGEVWGGEPSSLGAHGGGREEKGRRKGGGREGGLREEDGRRKGGGIRMRKE